MEFLKTLERFITPIVRIILCLTVLLQVLIPLRRPLKLLQVLPGLLMVQLVGARAGIVRANEMVGILALNRNVDSIVVMAVLVLGEVLLILATSFSMKLENISSIIKTRWVIQQCKTSLRNIILARLLELTSKAKSLDVFLRQSERPNTSKIFLPKQIG